MWPSDLNPEKLKTQSGTWRFDRKHTASSGHRPESKITITDTVWVLRGCSLLLVTSTPVPSLLSKLSVYSESA